MEMMIPQIASAQPQAQAATNGQASKSTGGAVFQKALVQQINGDAASGTANAQINQPAAIAAKAAAGETAVAAAPALSDLMSMIDGLLEQLAGPAAEDGEAPLADDEQMHQLEAVLDQMNALLTLFGIPVPLIQQQNKPLTAEIGSMTTDQQQAASIGAVKSNLQDTLLQLQMMLQQGTTKLIQQHEPTVLAAQQLQALTAILEGEPVDTNKPQTKSTAVQQPFTAQTVPQAEVSTLLQRLSQQSAVHPALLSAAAQSLEQGADSEAVPLTVETNLLVQPAASHSDSLRGFAPLVTKAAAATSFVVADEFAQTMTGMIVQKFDLTTVNGVSEAKILLFPEHLGQVDVRITMQNGLLTAIFQTDTAMAKDMLDNQMAQLRSALQAQGLMVDKLEVSQGQSMTQLSQQHHGQGSGQQQAPGRQFFNGDESSSEAQFETEMIEQAAIQGLGFGRGINVKA